MLNLWPIEQNTALKTLCHFSQVMKKSNSTPQILITEGIRKSGCKFCNLFGMFFNRLKPTVF